MDQLAGEFRQRHRSLSQFVASGYIQRMDSSHSRCGQFTGKSYSNYIHFSSLPQTNSLSGFSSHCLSLSLCVAVERLSGVRRACFAKAQICLCGQFALCLNKLLNSSDFVKFFFFLLFSLVCCTVAIICCVFYHFIYSV